MSKLIYIASPYTHNSRFIEHARFMEVSDICGRLTNKGHHVICCISMNHPWQQHCKEEVATDWAYWKEYDNRILAVCDEMWVCMMEGWEWSVGIDGEWNEADRLKIPVRLLDPKTLKVT